MPTRRYVVTHISKRAPHLRTLADPAQGRYTYATPEEAQAVIDSMIANNSPERLKEVYGLPLQVRPVWCYDQHHDPMNIYFD